MLDLVHLAQLGPGHASYILHFTEAVGGARISAVSCSGLLPRARLSAMASPVDVWLEGPSKKIPR